jgi:predicted nucleic acid-binding protein
VIVISDTSVFTNLAAIGHLHLLQQLYERIFIPTAVYQELTVDPPVPGTVEVQTLQWLEVCSVSDRAMVEQLQNTAQLDPGESEAIALALEINADLLLIDERRGRTEANRLGIRITLSRSMQAVSPQSATSSSKTTTVSFGFPLRFAKRLGFAFL